jgi:cysteine-rich repeat protein
LGASGGADTGGADAGLGGSAGAGGSATGGVAGVAGVGTAGSDSGVEDAGPDAQIDAPVSTVCGDGIRDPVTEECDDATGLTPADSCSADCRVQDVLVSPSLGSDSGIPKVDMRRLGLGRHTVAASASGFAVVFMDASTDDDAVMLRAFDANGVPGALITVANDASVLDQADPVVADLPAGKYAVAYADLNADGSLQGVALRIVDPATSVVGPLVRVNSPTALSQRDPEIIWTGSELVVAYLDEGNLPTKGDVKVRRFDANGSPKGGATALAATADIEGKAALAPFAGDYAIAWMAVGSNTNTLFAQAGAVSWSIALSLAGDGESQPSLVELDATHLLVTFVEGTGTSLTPHLRGAILDTTAPGSATPFDIAPLVEPYASDATLSQTQPALVRVGDRLFVAWKSENLTLTFEASELWLKEMTWSASGGTLTVDLSLPEIQLPRTYAHVGGHQDYPALAATPLIPGGALATAWQDWGQGFGSIEGKPDVVAELIPVPIVRLPGEGGVE